MLRAVIFDFDGVIADDERLHLQGFRLALSARGISLSEQQYWERYLGLDDRDAFEAILRDNSVDLDAAAVGELMHRKESAFRSLAQERVAMFPGVRELLAELKSQPDSLVTAIGSGALRSEILLVLGLLDLKAQFDVIVSANDVAHGKPHPETFVTACARLAEAAAPGLVPEECLVIEDSIAGLQAARAAGMRCVGVTNSYAAARLDADLVVASLADLSRERCEWLFRSAADESN